MATHPSASTLSFKLSGKVSPGCRYAVISWKPGKSARRDLVSCHRKRGTAKAAVKEYRAKKSKLGKFLRVRARMYGVYDLMNGKKVQ